MHPDRKRSKSSYWQILFRFEADKIAPWTGLRNAIGVVLALVAGALAGSPPDALVMAVGALNTAYSDGRDPYGQRARRMFATSLLCGVAVFAGGLVAGHHAGAIVVAAAMAVGTGMMVALGTTPADVGMIALVTFLVFSSRVMAPADAAFSGLLAVWGGLVQAALGIAFWPVYRYRNERRALADLYRELGRAAEVAAPAGEAPPASVQSTRAQEALRALEQDRSVEAERYVALLRQGERIRLTLLVLARLRWRMAQVGEEHAATVDRALGLAAGLLGFITEVLSGRRENAEGTSFDALNAISEQLRRARASAESDERQALLMDARSQIDALSGQLRATLDLATHATPEGLSTFARAEAGRPWWLRLRSAVAVLRANINWRSGAFRHAVRLAVCVMLGITIGRMLDVQRSYWIPMTVAIVLKPDFSSTFSRGVLRILGTLIGLAVATGLFHVLAPSPPVLIGLIGVFAFVLRCFGAANYGIFAAAITALIVLLFADTGVAPQAVIAARGWNTLAGGIIALAAYAAWPTWERTQVRELFARLLEAYRRYFQLVRGAYLASSPEQWRDLDRARLAARLARSNLEASVSRLMGEPGGDTERAIWPSALSTAHRFIHAVMALEAGLITSPTVPARAEFRSFADEVDRTLYFLAAALRGSKVMPTDFPDLRESYHSLIRAGDAHVQRYALVNTEADRITNSLNTLREDVLERLGAG